MTEAEKLQAALVWHDYAIRYTFAAIAALLKATDFDATPPERHKARSAAARDVQIASKALEQAQLVKVVDA